jgi:hypothetical protein
MKMGAEHRWDGNDREKPKYLLKNLLPATLPIRSLTNTELGSNPCVRGEKSGEYLSETWNSPRLYLSAFKIKITCNFLVPFLWKDSKGNLLGYVH